MGDPALVEVPDCVHHLRHQPGGVGLRQRLASKGLDHVTALRDLEHKVDEPRVLPPEAGAGVRCNPDNINKTKGGRIAAAAAVFLARTCHGRPSELLVACAKGLLCGS